MHGSGFDSDAGASLSQIVATSLTILTPALWRFLPDKILSIHDRIPRKEDRIMHNFRDAAKQLARQAIENVARDDSKDLGTILARASDEKKMDKDETLSQSAAITLGGEEPPSNAIAWVLYELSRRPDHQTLVREEIRKGSGDYESMPLLNAAINETFRLHPILYNILRCATEDDVIPLSEPIQTVTGET